MKENFGTYVIEYGTKEAVMSGWDWVHAGLEVATYAQARKARQNAEMIQADLQTAAAIAARKEAQEALIKAMRNFIFEVHRDIQRAEEHIRSFPQQAFIVAKSLEWKLKDSGLTPEVFPEFSDKDYVYNTQKKINAVISESASRLSEAQVDQAESAVKCLVEMPLLQEAIQAKSSLEQIQATEEEWKAVEAQKNGAKTKKNFGILGLVATPCLCLGATSVAGTNSSAGAIIGFIVLIGAIALLAGSNANLPRHDELKALREIWRKNLLPANVWNQVVEKFGDLPGEQYQKILDDRITFLEPVLGNEFQRVLAES